MYPNHEIGLTNLSNPGRGTHSQILAKKVQKSISSDFKNNFLSGLYSLELAGNTVKKMKCHYT